MSSRRTRGRNNSRGRQQNIRNQQMDSNGPGSRIRGTPQQILDRYLALARDSMSSGDTVLYENLMQHAEHYARLLNASAPPPQQSQQNANQPGYQNGRDEYDDEGGYGQSESGEETSAVNGRSAEPAMNGSDRGMDYSDAEQPPTPEVWNGIEQPIPDHQPNGEQQAAPSRRRRRSRYQRNQDQGGDEGAESASGEDSSATRVNGHAREAETERSAAPEFAGGNDTAAPDMQEPPHRNESSDS